MTERERRAEEERQRARSEREDWAFPSGRQRAARKHLESAHRELDAKRAEVAELERVADAAGKALAAEATVQRAEQIRRVCSELAEFLCEKNASYGDSAANPIGVFAKGLDAEAQIHVRIDDKLNRIKRGSEYPGDDTVKDLAGYLVLLMVVRAAKGGE